VTYKRETALLEGLRTLQPHTTLFHEILIVDNGNSAGLEARARLLLGGRLTVLRQRENLGAVARAIGIQAATGDIIVTLDDDVQLVQPEQLSNLASLFASHNRIGCVNFKILYPDGTLDISDWCHPRDHELYADRLFETSYISEGACALNGTLIKNIGTYPLDLFIGQEGVELAARILDSDYGIYYLPSVTVTHTVAAEGRASGRQFYFNTRNIYWIALRTFPIGLAFRTVLREWLTLFMFALLRWRMNFFLRGCWHGLRRTPELLRGRQPIRHVSARRIVELSSLKPSVWRRAARLGRSKTLD
jgi:GT2 family glycosyltransferase